jgi:hypothetical protein
MGCLGAVTRDLTLAFKFMIREWESFVILERSEEFSGCLFVRRFGAKLRNVRFAQLGTSNSSVVRSGSRHQFQTSMNAYPEFPVETATQLAIFPCESSWRTRPRV